MKKLIVILTVMMTIVAVQAQDKVIQPQISVSGEGKVKVIPDEAVISIAVETKGEESAKVKKENDVAVDKVLKYLKSTKIMVTDNSSPVYNPPYYRGDVMMMAEAKAGGGSRETLSVGEIEINTFVNIVFMLE